MTSKLREDAAKFICNAGLRVRAESIECVSGYWLRVDCYRFEFLCEKNNVRFGCWLPLSQFVKECRQHGGAAYNMKEGEIWPSYPQSTAKPDTTIQ